MVLGSIKEGPGRFDLMLALFEGKWVQFKVRMDDWPASVSAVVEAKIYGVVSDLSYQNGRRDSWIINGHLKFNDAQKAASGDRGTLFEALYFTAPDQEGSRGRITPKNPIPQV